MLELKVKIDVRIALIVAGIVLAVAAMVAIVSDVTNYRETIDAVQEDPSADEYVLGSTIEEAPFENYAARKVYWPGLKEPATVLPDEVKLANDAEIIGVTANGRSRAYLTDAFKMLKNTTWKFAGDDLDMQLTQPKEPFAQLVVNDVVGGVPITVTYCENQECIRVFTAADDQEPLDVWLAELTDSQIILNYKDTNYPQKSSEIPLQEYPFQRTSWQSWLDAYPDTDIYIGGFQPDTGKLESNPSILHRRNANIDILFRSAELQYRNHDGKDVLDDGLDEALLYDLLEIDPLHVPTLELLAEHFAKQGNDVLAQTYRDNAREAREAAEKQKAAP